MDALHLAWEPEGADVDGGDRVSVARDLPDSWRGLDPAWGRRVIGVALEGGEVTLTILEVSP